MFNSQREKQVSLPGGRTVYKDGRKAYVAYIEAGSKVEEVAGKSVRWFKKDIYGLEYETQLFVFPGLVEREPVSVLVLSAPSAAMLSDRISRVLAAESDVVKPVYAAERQAEFRALVNSGERLVACAQREGGVH